MSIPINDISPRTQITAGAGQTVFIFPFPIFAATDLKVYLTPAGQIGNDAANILTYVLNYTVTGVGAANGGTVVLVVATAINDIITIVRDMPEDRMNLYLNGGLFTATAVNDDFSRDVMMNQQNEMREAILTPHYNSSGQVSLVTTRDQLLPILPPNTSWRMNGAGTAIEAFTLLPNGNGIVLPTVVNSIAIFTDVAGTLASSIFLVPAADGNNGDAITTNGAGQLQASTLPGINRLVNGDMQVWQRGAGGAATFAVAGGTNRYTADRWQFVAGAATNMTVSQQAGATSGSFRARIQRDAAGAGVAVPTFAQSLPRNFCIGAAGNYVTLTFKAIAGANFSAAGALLTANIITGTGVNDVSAVTTGFTGQAVAATTNVPVPGALQTFRLTTGAPLAANITQLAVSFTYVPVGVAGAADYFEITDVQLEVSRFASPYQRLSFSDQLFRSQTFYQKSFAYNVLPAQNTGLASSVYLFPATLAGAVGNVFSTINLTPNMFTGPVVTYFNPGAANALIRDFTAAVDFTTTTTQQVDATNLTYVGVGNAGTAAGNLCGLHYTLEAELV